MVNYYLGFSVSISENGMTFIVGVPRSDIVQSVAVDRGHVQIYTYNTTVHDYMLVCTLNGTTALDQFGYSVSMSADGTTVVVGATGQASTIPGYVKIYQYNSTVHIMVRQPVITLVGP